MSQENVELVRRGVEAFRSGLVYEFEGGRVIRCRNYFNHAGALDAVGLLE